MIGTIEQFYNIESMQTHIRTVIRLSNPTILVKPLSCIKESFSTITDRVERFK